jgi:hypothetical protein
MNRDLIVFAQSLIGGAFDWIALGIEETTSFMREWVASRFNAQVFGAITVTVVVFAILARVNSNRRQ